MLTKLIKYDNRAIRRTLMPILLAVLGAGLLIGLLFGFNMLASDTGPANIVVTAFTGILIVLLIIGMLASSAVSMVFIYLRFYKNLMTDEGYLSFTLPVTVDQHILSKFISTFIWCIISFLVIVAAWLIAVFMIFLMVGGLTPELWEGLKYGFDYVFDWIFPEYTYLVVELLLSALVGLAAEIMKVFLAITIGSILARQLKILASIGFYLAINTSVSIVSTIINAVVQGLALSSQSYGGTADVGFLTYLSSTWLANGFLSIIVAVVCYVILRKLLHNKLNLS